MTAPGGAHDATRDAAGPGHGAAEPTAPRTPPSGYPPPPYPPYPPSYPPSYPPPYPPPYPQPGYSAEYPAEYPPGYYGGYPPPMPPQVGYWPQPGRNPLAVISLICSMAGLFCCVGSIAGILLGMTALEQIKRNRQEGYGLAVAGIVVGIAALAVNLVVVIFAINSR